MKVLFAVNNEDISESIIKLYQKEYKEIISGKNVYYFNAIIKELQRDQTYDRVVISEDLEPYTNNNFDIIDKFLFEQLDKISDEAISDSGSDIPIIFIATDRRSKSDNLLSKLFSIGIYDALLGSDRTIPEVCKLLNKPRTKKESKVYYKIETEEVTYQAESEDSVSETEIQNIITHYKKLGKNTDRYVESFNNIAAQYTDAQLRIITKFLPIGVRAVLEQESPKYQSIMTFGEGTYKDPEKKKDEKKDDLKIGFIESNATKTRPTKPVVIPSAVNKDSVRKLTRKVDIQQEPVQEEEEIKQPNNLNDMFLDEENENEEQIVNEPEISHVDETPEEEPVKKRRGRPKKILTPEEEEEKARPKKRGRPKKVIEQPEIEDVDEQEAVLPGFEEPEDDVLPGFENDVEEIADDSEEEPNLFALGRNTKAGNESDTDDSLSKSSINENTILGGSSIFGRNSAGQIEEDEEEDRLVENRTDRFETSDISSVLTKDKKIVSFVGTAKAGTSFLINNLADMLSRSGIKTAILDLTENRNSYYIYTKNEEPLRRITSNCLEKIENGIVEGIEVSKNLTVFTSVPNQKVEVGNIEMLVSNLVKKYSLILLDCDFTTPDKYFELAQEIYLVQSMDILTIQPLTAFLRDLQSNNKLVPSKLKVVINKEMKVRGLSTKAIVGGMSCYNNPEMSYMRELFDRDKIPVITIPFDEDALSKYLSGMVDCFVSTSGYSKQFISELKSLGDHVYPLVSSRFRPDYEKATRRSEEGRGSFSNSMSDTLNKMKQGLK